MTYSTVGRHAERETLVEPSVAAFPVQQLPPEVIQLVRLRQVELKRLAVQRQHERGALNEVKRDFVGALGEKLLARVGPLRAVPGGEGSEELLAVRRRRFTVEDQLELVL